MKTFRRVIAILCLFMFASFVFAQSEEGTLTFTYRDGRNVWVWDVWSVLGNGSWPEFRAAVLELNPEIVARGFENLPPGTEIEMPLALLDIRVNGTEALLGDLALVPVEDLEGLRGTVEIQGFAIQAQSDRIEALSAEVASLEATNARLASSIEAASLDTRDIPIWFWIALAIATLLALLFLVLLQRAYSRERSDAEFHEEEKEALRNELSEAKLQIKELQEKRAIEYEAHQAEIETYVRLYKERLASEKRNYREIIKRIDDQHSELKEHNAEIKSAYAELKENHRRLAILSKRRERSLLRGLKDCEDTPGWPDSEALKESSEVGTRSRRRRGTHGEGRQYKHPRSD